MTNQQWLADIGRLNERSAHFEKRGAEYAAYAATEAGDAALMAWLWPADEMAAALCLRAAELWLAVDHRRAGWFLRLALALRFPSSTGHEERVWRLTSEIVKRRNHD